MTLTPEDAKRWLRRYLIRRRQSIRERERRLSSRRIGLHLQSMAVYKKASVLAAFLGFGSEVQTQTMIEFAWNDGKQVLIPITDRGFKRPYFALFNRGDRLRATARGPFELTRAKESFDFGRIDLVLVPGLGFDAQGFRLGYGGGIYDRILEKTPRAPHVGLFFSAQRLHRIPVQPHDRPLSAIVTENGPVFLKKNVYNQTSN